MKIPIPKLFIYKHRFIIGYILLAIVFGALLIFLPSISPNGLSEDEMQSTISSHNLTLNSIFHGDLISAPYRLLQNLSIGLFGLSIYAVKLPSIILGFATAILLILLLNRWFKSNVALLASCISTLTTSFLFAAGTGTDIILLIFWPTLILWLGSKIIGKSKINPILLCALFISIALSIYTPHFIYIAVAIAIFSFAHPHTRFTLKTLPRLQLIIASVLAILLIAPLIFSALINQSTLKSLLITSDLTNFNPLENLSAALTPLFSFGGGLDSNLLAPLFGLGSITLVIVGAIALANKLFTSQGAITVLLTVFALAISALDSGAFLLIFLPISILTALGIELVLEKWYGLFPENPYARIVGLLPVTFFLTLIIATDLLHFAYGYHYNPTVTSKYTDDLTIIHRHLPSGSVLLIEQGTAQYDFYKILEDKSIITITDKIPDRLDAHLATLGKWSETIDLPLKSIYTSPKSTNSDRLYIYKQE